MGYKDLGPNTSQTPADIASGNAYSGEEKSFESVVILEAKPIIDWEMNLRSEIKRDHGLRLSNQRRFPSFFLVTDAMDRSDVLGSYVMLSPVPGTTENKFQLRATDAIINGWDVRVEYSGITTAGMNEIELGAPPAVGGRTDLVILEVWRALVQQPSAANKSPTGLILRHGNVKAPDGVNFADDLLDPNYAAESSARVQIQYRLRVVNGVSLDTYPDGLDDPSVFAHTVSDFSGPGADGTATALNYFPVPDDAGLWRAGSGNAASAAILGTVDGHMYAVPVCAVVRRNTTAFSRSSNLNGGNLIAVVIPTRPDGVFADQVVAEDVKDLRKACPSDFAEILQKAYQQVLDNSLTTELEASPFGTSGTSILAVDNLISPSEHIGQPDRVRRHFSDRSVTETIVAKFDMGGLPASGVTFSLYSLEVPWYPSGISIPVRNPGVSIIGVNAVRIVNASAMTDKDMFDVASPIRVDRMLLDPASEFVTVLFNTTASNVRILAELMIEYPAGIGAQRNVLRPHAFWTRKPSGASNAWIDTSTFLPTSDLTREEMPYPVPGYARNLWWVDPGHRELSVRYETVTQNVTYYTVATDKLLIPERLNGDPITITDGTNPAYPTTNYTLNTAYTTVQLSGGTPIPAGTAVAVDYVAFRPLTILSTAPADSHQFFYQSAAVQSLLPPAGTQTLPLIPRGILNFLSVLTVGSGSPDDSFPFIQASAQLPVGALPAPSFPESKLDNPADISLIGFGINTGYLQIPALIPYVPSPQEVTLFRDGSDVVTDADGRNFWPRSDDGSTSLYSPVLYGQELAFPQRHKIALPLLAELKSDFPSIGRKGTLVLVVLTRWMNFDAKNGIALTDTPGESAAAVYRVRGNMMNPRRTNP